MKAYVAYKLPHLENVTIQKGVATNYNNIEEAIYTNGFIFNAFNSKLNYLISSLTNCQLNDFKLFTNNDNNHITTQNDYLTICNSLIEYLNQNHLEKVILSRLKKINNRFDPIELFKSLNTHYKNTFNYIISIEGMGCWIGSTPEILLTKTKNRFKTVSIAGTKHTELNEWGEKELEEQQIVTDYISDTLHTNSIDFSTSKTETIKAGQVFHLKTNFEGQLNNNLTQLIQALHPTPATCGLPKDKAKLLIESVEKHKRKFYTGFLGPTTQENTNLFVNLRCIEIQKTCSFLYLGGGITAQSIALDEWNETENKAKTLLHIISKLPELKK